MKTFNLKSIIQAYNSMNEEDFKMYIEFLKINFKSRELFCIEGLCRNFDAMVNLDGFSLGYSIPQIGKEFDLLRFGKGKVINIELKSETDLDVIKKQIERNTYYLGFLEEDICIFTYTLDENKLYMLDSNKELKEISFDDFKELLNSQLIIKDVCLDERFLPSNYLVSPFNSTEKFIENNYFLTQDQERMKKEILEAFASGLNNIQAITGDAGTGKTLLVYDIAKTLMSNKEKIGIIHCAELNEGQRLLNNEGWDINRVGDTLRVLEDDSYDVIIVDEAQRIYTNQLNAVFEYVTSKKKRCIFSYDSKQCFSNAEFARANPKKIKDEFGAREHKLKNKIRSNKEIAFFVHNLFNPRQSRLGNDYKCVEVQYFNNTEEVAQFALDMSKYNWQIINFTPSQFNRVSYDRYQHWDKPTAHGVIGQEYDKVLAIIDSNFYMDGHNYLVSRRVAGAPRYDLDKMLYQILTRAREKLFIVVLNNQSILKRCINIINAK